MAARRPLPESVLARLPTRWRAACEALPAEAQRSIAELRLRVGQPVAAVMTDGRHRWLGPAGFVADPRRAPAFRPEEAEGLLQAVSDSSVYALEEQLGQGFVTLPGGHRVGFSGEAALTGGRPRTLRHVGSFMIRISRAVPGCGEKVARALVDVRGRPRSTLIVSPPGCGKTTLLRDLARLFSWGAPRLGVPGLNVGVADERSEIAASFRGVPRHDLGPRADVADNSPKAFGIMQLLRGMAPDVIFTDEIGRPEDALAVQEALHGGVAVFASAHGASWDDVARRPGLQALCEPVAFERVVVLSARRGPGTVESIHDPRLPSRRGHKSSASSIHIR